MDAGTLEDTAMEKNLWQAIAAVLLVLSVFVAAYCYFAGLYWASFAAAVIAGVLAGKLALGNGH